MNTEQIVEEVKAQFNGRDPIEEAQVRMKEMNNSELRKLVLIASNQIGMLIKGCEYESPLDAVLCLSAGVDGIITAYDSASMGVQATTNEVGSC